MFTLFVTCLSGLCIGLYGAIQPGPLMTLIVSESIQRGRRAGMTVACVPIVTDPLILLAGVLFVATVPDTVAAVISFGGAAVLILFGRRSLRGMETAADEDLSRKKGVNRSRWKPNPLKSEKSRFVTTTISESSFGRAIAVNLLNPYLYIFAFTINAPIISNHLRCGRFFSAVGYPLFFFAGIIAVNAVIAAAAGTFRPHSSPRLIRSLSRFLSYALFFMAALAIWRGLLFLI